MFCRVIYFFSNCTFYFYVFFVLYAMWCFSLCDWNQRRFYSVSYTFSVYFQFASIRDDHFCVYTQSTNNKINVIPKEVYFIALNGARVFNIFLLSAVVGLCMVEFCILSKDCWEYRPKRRGNLSQGWLLCRTEPEWSQFQCHSTVGKGATEIGVFASWQSSLVGSCPLISHWVSIDGRVAKMWAHQSSTRHGQ